MRRHRAAARYAGRCPPVTPERASSAVTLEIGGRPFRADLGAGHDLAIALAFDGVQPRWFGAPPARSTALCTEGFSGRVAGGASCNCSTFTLTPHCDGTHTECAGHLTLEPLDVRTVVPLQPVPALLLSVATVAFADGGEGSRPEPLPGDRLVTAAALAAAWPANLAYAPRALIVRTLPNPAAKRRRDYGAEPAAFLSLPAAEWLARRGIEHLVLDLPSADRAADGGQLSAHRTFFGLPAGSTALAAVARPHCTITELAYADDSIADGCYLLMLQIPSLGGDAVPSRPILYPVRAA
jgi:kynurenine formamidase